MDEALKNNHVSFFNYDLIESSSAHVKFEINVQKQEKFQDLENFAMHAIPHNMNELKNFQRHNGPEG